MKIKKIKVERFRSINVLELTVDQNENIIAICGKNNVGKTNFLRAINVFFNPEMYDKHSDMTTLKQATGGGTIHPKITITFADEENKKEYEIVRDFNKREKDESDLSGNVRSLSKTRCKNTLDCKAIQSFLQDFEFVYIESINVILPQLINDISNDVIDARYYKARFANSKLEMKEKYDAYIEGLNDVLDSFAKDISATFKEFQPEWCVRFDVPKNSDSFRELISNDVTLQLDDSGSVGIEDKGAGLQRLAAILLQFELLERKKNKKFNIVCIDEPDVYIHEGLQQKLRKFLDEKATKAQIFLTTHSKVFLNEYTMKNVFLFDANYRVQYSQRKKKNINVVETFKVDTSVDDGYKKICEHLGIEIKTYEPLAINNLIVEGGCDKKYITELSKYFGFAVPNIISADGADNIVQYLRFFDSYYKDESKRPFVKTLLDDDTEGRKVFDAIKPDTYKNIKVEKYIIPNFNGERCEKNGNHEVEDFIYPEIVVFLANQIINKKGMIAVDAETVCRKIKTPAYKDKGILYVLENEKNDKNPETGNSIVFECAFKKGMAQMFEIKADINLISIIEEGSRKYPKVKEFLNTLITFNE